MTEYPVFHIDKDDDAQMRAIHMAEDFYKRIIEAQNLALMNEINANAVVINGRKYGMLKDKPGIAPTIFGMKAETNANMPDEWDFFLQESPSQPKTNYDRIINKTPEELARWIVEIADCDECEEMHGFRMCDAAPEKACEDCWAGWLRREAEEGE